MRKLRQSGKGSNSRKLLGTLLARMQLRLNSTLSSYTKSSTKKIRVSVTLKMNCRTKKRKTLQNLHRSVKDVNVHILKKTTQRTGMLLRSKTVLAVMCIANIKRKNATLCLWVMLRKVKKKKKKRRHRFYRRAILKSNSKLDRRSISSINTCNGTPSIVLTSNLRNLKKRSLCKLTQRCLLKHPQKLLVLEKASQVSWMNL